MFESHIAQCSPSLGATSARGTIRDLALCDAARTQGLQERRKDPNNRPISWFRGVKSDRMSQSTYICISSNRKVPRRVNPQEPLFETTADRSLKCRNIRAVSDNI